MREETKSTLLAALRDLAGFCGLADDGGFRSKSIARAAQNLALVDEDLAVLLLEGRLQTVPGVGPSITTQIEELLRTGTIAELAALRKRYGAAGAGIAARTGLSGAQIERLHAVVGLDSKSGLLAAARDGQIRVVPGFGSRSEAALVAQLEGTADARAVLYRHEVEAVVERVIDRLRRYGIAAWPTGSYRRGDELPSRVELVADDRYRDAVPTALRAAGALSIDSGPSDTVARMPDGVIVRVHLASRARIGVVLALTTASDTHGRALAQRAIDRGTTLAALTADTEAELYAALDLPLPPPEQRWGLPQARVTKPIDAIDVKGFVHCHTAHTTIAEMAAAAEAMGATYLTITDHAPGLSLERLRRQWDEIDHVQASTSVRLLKGAEVDILADGALGYPDALLERLDVVITSVHRRHGLDRAAMTARVIRAIRHPLFKIWGHPLGRLLPARPAIDLDMAAVLDAAVGARVAFEISGDPYRLDLPVEWIAEAKHRGLRFVLSSDAQTPKELRHYRHAVTMARRAGLQKDDVLNTKDAASFAAIVSPRRRQPPVARSPSLRLA